MSGESIKKRKILFVPNHTAGMGTGHIQRCLSLAGKIREKGYGILFYERRGTNWTRLFPAVKPENIINKIQQADDVKLLVVDNRQTGVKEFRALDIGAPVIGIDEGGRARLYMHYIIDTLPLPRGFTTPNQTVLHPGRGVESKKAYPFPFKKILITFGGEDKSDLSRKLLDVLLKNNIFNPGDITVIQGQNFTTQHWPAGIKIIRSPRNLQEIIPGYDLVFCHFGLTCFESLQACIPVILLNPSLYHRKLARQCRLPEIGIGKPSPGKIRKILADREVFRKLHITAGELLSAAEPNQAAIDQIISDFTLAGNIQCPVCALPADNSSDKVVERFRERTYFQCKKCSLIYLAVFFYPEPPAYNREYFFSQYKQQYGKTYLEDFNNIKNLSRNRLLECIRWLPGPSRKKMLDIGCAFGPALKAFKELGGEAYGLDISRDAVEYISRKLKMDAWYWDFEQQPVSEIPAAPFDLVTMWFVIEHFKNLQTVLKKVNRILKPGGIFAFSTPSSCGISARKNRREFLKNSPLDHFTIWHPGTAGRILENFGFKTEKIRNTGHHPERFPGMTRQMINSIVWKSRSIVSRLFHLGDTFEVYARKVRNIEN